MTQITLNPYLMFAGSARDAMTFYQQVFGGELAMQSYGEAAGMPVPDEHKDKIMHARLNAEAITLMASDGQPGEAVTMGDNIHLAIGGADAARLGAAFAALAVGGVVTMPLAKQFWGDTFGMLTDRFGVHWMVNVDAA